jgi:hypothetical protein
LRSAWLYCPQVAWRSEIVPALISDTTPRSIVAARLPTNPVCVLDLALLIPLYLSGAVQVLRNVSAGSAECAALLVLNVLLGLSVISSTLFQYRVDPSLSLGIIPLFAAISMASLCLVIWHLQKARLMSPALARGREANYNQQRIL